MAEERQTLALTLYKPHQISNERKQQQKIPIYTNPNSSKAPNKCFIYVFSGFVFLAVAALIFSSIVLRVNPPTLRLSSLSLSKFSPNSTSQSLHLIFTPQFALQNSNFGPFNFDNGSLAFTYAGAVVARSPTGRGRAEAKASKSLNVTVEANFATNVSNFGVLNLTGFVNLRGRVRLIHVLRKTVSSEIACSVHLDLNSHRFLPHWVCQ